MKVLFVEAPYSYRAASSIVGAYFPLGIGYLAAYVRRQGHTVSIFMPSTNCDYDSSLLQEVSAFKPDLVGFSIMTPSYPEAVRLAEMLKKKNDKTLTVFGGHHVSAMGVKVLQEAQAVDFLVIGEGELTLTELLGFLEKSSCDFSRIRGLAWRDSDGTIRENPRRELIEELDSLPFPARDLVDMGRFKLHSYIDFGKRSATMITSRGCPYKCIFCSSRLTMGSHYRWRSAENVLGEVKELIDKFGVDHIVFEDDTITLRRDRILAICAGLKAMPNRPSWYCLSRVNGMDEDLAQIMRSAGCRMVSFGIESGSPEILEKIGKKIDLHQAEKAVAACTRAKLRTLCTFIVGFPFDTKETMDATLAAAKRIAPTIAIFFPLTPYPGTEIFDSYVDNSQMPGSINDWRDYIVTGETEPASANSLISFKQIREISVRWNRRFFFRPSQVWRIFRTVKSLPELTRVIQAGLYLLRAAIKV